MTSLRLLLATGALLTLGACGSSDAGEAPPVASLATGGPSAAASASAEPGVQMRLDTTSAEQAQFFQQWQDCLFKNGARRLTDEPVPVGKLWVDIDGAPQKALDACANKRPIGPPEMDPDKNPNFAVQWEDYVQCLRDHGYMVHSTEPGSWTYDSDNTVIPENSEKLEIDCQVEVFGAGKK